MKLASERIVGSRIEAKLEESNEYLQVSYRDNNM